MVFPSLFFRVRDCWFNIPQFSLLSLLTSLSEALLCPWVYAGVRNTVMNETDVVPALMELSV